MLCHFELPTWVIKLLKSIKKCQIKEKISSRIMKKKCSTYQLSWRMKTKKENVEVCKLALNINKVSHVYGESCETVARGSKSYEDEAQFQFIETKTKIHP